MHIDVKPDGKVWIQHDGTGLKIALLLVEQGITRDEILLAFHVPHRRKLIAEFAVEWLSEIFKKKAETRPILKA